jgi:hypothetical protein
VVAVWQTPYPQHLTGHGGPYSTEAAALAAGLVLAAEECGRQVDVYLYSTPGQINRVNVLFAGGVLDNRPGHGPQDHELLAPGGKGVAWVLTGPCDSPSPTPTPTTTPTPTPSSTPTHTVTPSPPTRPSPPTPPRPSLAPPLRLLAHTGPADLAIWGALGLGLGLAGLIVLGMARVTAVHVRRRH